MSKVDGKMKADKRKGQVAVVRNNDGLVVLQWYERISGEDGTFSLAEEPEVDQIVFEWEGRMEWLNKDKRVLTMKFKEDADRALYFWLQEPETKWDEELLLRANKAINGHSWVPTTAPGPSTTAAATASTPAAATPQPAAPSSSSALPLTPDGQLFNLDQLIAGMQARLQHQQAAAGPALADILTADAVSDFMKMPGMLEALQEHLPKEHRTQEELEALPRTAQFVQQLQGFSAALRTGHMDLSQFGLQPKGLTVIDFLEAIKALVAAEKREKDDGASPMES